MEINNMADRPIPRPQEIYRHFKDKGMLYQIITIARHTETDEDMVVYQALYGDYKIYTRPLDMFMSRVDREKYPGAEAVYRFEKCEKAEEDKAAFKTGEVHSTSKGDTLKGDTECVSSDLLEFLDAKTYEQQRNLLVHMRPRMTQSLIDNIAASMDVTVDEGDLEERYQSLLNCIKTREKYEILDRH